MDYRDLINILIKIVGIAIIGFAIINIPTYVSYYFSLPDGGFLSFIGVSVVPAFIPLFAGVFMLLFPTVIANKIIVNTGDAIEPKIAVKHIEHIAFTVLGLYFLFHVISDFVYHFASMYIAIQQNNLKGYDTGIEHPYALLACTSAELIFALYLIFGTKNLIRFINKFRTIGTK